MMPAPRPRSAASLAAEAVALAAEAVALAARAASLAALAAAYSGTPEVAPPAKVEAEPLDGQPKSRHQAITAVKCLRCGHKWPTRAAGGNTVRCPDCGWPRRVPLAAGARDHVRPLAASALYVTVDREARRVKFGITSGNAKRRLSVHRLDGYSEVVRLYVGLPVDLAPEIERACVESLAREGFRSIAGRREYFPLDALPVVLATVDAYGLTNETGPGIPEQSRPGQTSRKVETS